MENKGSARQSLHRYPYFFGVLSNVVISVLAQILVVIDCFVPILTLAPDAVSSVMSTCSEVVAGLYGITLTGYIFFADHFQNTSREDESLYDAVQALLLRYNHIAGIISVMCLVCIVCGEVIVLYGGNTVLPQGLYRFIVNETLLIFYLTFVFILYFVISVLDPYKVSRISTQKKTRISDDKTAGNPEEFMAAWASIEDILYAMRESLISTVRFVPTAKPKSTPQIIHAMELLRNYGRISPVLWRKLDKLRQYHNLALHDPGMAVSQEMCDLAKEVLSELESRKK